MQQLWSIDPNGLLSDMHDELGMDCVGRVKNGMKDSKLIEDNPVVHKVLEEKGYIAKWGRSMIKNAPTLLSAYKSIARYRQPQVQNFDRNLRRKAVDMVGEHLFHTIGPQRLATVDEVKEYTDMTKSCGWPIGIYYRTVKDLYDTEEKWLEHMFDTAHTGDWVSGVGIVVKEELREISKVEAGKNRTIASVDKAHVHCHKRIMLFQNIAACDRPIQTKFALGFNPYRGGMHMLAAYLGGKKDINRGWEFDIGKMDASICWQMQSDLEELDIMMIKANQRTKVVEAKVRMLRYMLYVTTIIMPDGFVFKKGGGGEGGNDSGQFLTAWDNCREALIRFFYAWLVLTGLGWSEFNEFVMIIILGDDVTFTVHRKFLGIYTGRRIAQVLYDDFGVVLETPSWDCRPWHQLGFLQMHFNQSETGLWIHTLNPDRVVSSLLQGGKRDKLNQPIPYLERLCGVRNASWGDEQVRQMVVEVKEAWEKEHAKLVTTNAWQVAARGWLSDRMLEKLYSGAEAALQDQLPLQCLSDVERQLFKLPNLKD